MVLNQQSALPNPSNQRTTGLETNRRSIFEQATSTVEESTMEAGRVRRRCLPHIDVDDRPTFITACLQGSLSQLGLSRIREFRDEVERRKKPMDLVKASGGPRNIKYSSDLWTNYWMVRVP